MTGEDNKRTITEFLAAFSSDPVQASDRYLDESANWWVAGTTPASGDHTKTEITALMKDLCAGFRDGLRLTPVSFTAEGDRVAVEAESDGVLANGRVYRNTYHFLFVVTDSRIHEIKEFMDTQHLQAVFFEP